MEMAEQGGAEPRAGKAPGGAPVLAGRSRLLAVHRAADGGAEAAAAADDKCKGKGNAGAVLEDNRELIKESIEARIEARIRDGIRERIREDIDYDLRVHLPRTLARANALQMAFDSC